MLYDSFGNITHQSNPDVDFRFGYTGREFDEETGNYYYRARYFDSSTGQFISQDQFSFSAGDANLYRYVGNSSINYLDPSGNFVEALVGGGLIALGTGISLLDPFTPFGEIVGVPLIAQGLYIAGQGYDTSLSSPPPIINTASTGDPYSTQGLGAPYPFGFQNGDSLSADDVNAQPTDLSEPFSTNDINTNTGSVESPNIEENVGGFEDVRTWDEIGQTDYTQEIRDLIESAQNNACIDPDLLQELQDEFGDDDNRNTGRPRGANRRDRQQINDVAREYDIDRRDFGDFVEEQKDGRRNDDNFTYDQLRELAETYRDLYGR